jgi:hypothetical protein
VISPLRLAWISVVAWSTAAPAANWVATGVDMNRTYAMDLDSVSGADTAGNRRLWVRLDLTGDPHGHGSYALQQWEVRCPTRQARTLGSTTYRADGRIAVQQPTPFSTMGDTAPGSVQRAIEDVACGFAIAPAPPPRPAADPAVVVAAMAVPVFDDDIPGARYQILGPVSVRISKATAFSSPADRAKVYGLLWAKARVMGADAVIHAAHGRSPLTLMSWGGSEASGEAIKLVRGG